MKDENENLEEKGIVAQNSNYQVSDFSGLGNQTNTLTNVYTNITDEKKIFNLENKVDFLLNDCEGEKIRVREILIKVYKKPMKEPIIDDETGEVLKDIETTMSCVLVDDNNKSYATGSKTFTIQLMRYLQLRNRIGETEGSFDIQIIKKKVGDKGNKALSFELV